jgi:hypothetical protein
MNRSPSTAPSPWRIAWIVASALVSALLTVPNAATGPKFLRDDPLGREPETQDASKAQEWTIDLFIDLTTNLFGSPGDDTPGVHAMNVNTIDEVADSSWFTNRVLARSLSLDEIARGPSVGNGPAPGPLTVVAAKEVGFAPGFTATDSAGERWFVSFDANGYSEAATGAIMVANRIFWALGYWQVDNALTQVRPEQVKVGEAATFVPMSGTRRNLRASDLDAVWRRAHRSADGSYRAIAGRALPGRPLGGFRYYGTRPDDPNDIVPHEHRRELRALKVFGAWTNLVDMKAGNTLDVLVTDNGRGFVRHYLQDVGSTFGSGANGPREYDEGWEHLVEPDLIKKRLITLGFAIKPWQTAQYEDVPAIGPFEGDVFDPPAWKPRVPTAAFRHAQPDDSFWAARRVAAFSDDMIRAVVKTARYSDPEADRHLAEVLIKRRDKIAAAYLPAVNPLVNFALTPAGMLSFQNAAVQARVAQEPASYRVAWSLFDNATGNDTTLGETAMSPGQGSQAPAPLPASQGSVIRVSVSAVAPSQKSWATPIDAYFRRTADGWSLVGLDRRPS